MKKLLPLTAGLLFAAVSFAQCPKFCFFEEFTQAGCYPCAQQNAQYEPNLLTPNPVKIRMVSIHTSWPGTDPMYTHNTVGNNYRTSFYNIFGVPQMRLLGSREVSGPSMFTQADVDKIWNEGSPLKITVSTVDNGNNRDAFVTVTSVGTPPLGNYTLYVAVVQHDTTFTTPPGQNGETFFPYVFRQMLPTNAGQPISLPFIGNSVTMGPYNFLEDAGFWVNPNKIEVIAFIQNNQTKEVIQSGSSMDPPVNGAMTAPSSDIQNVAANSTQNFSFTVGNTGSSSEQFNFTLTSSAPSGWSANYSINSITYTAPVNMSIFPNTFYNATINVTPNSNAGVGKYILTMKSLDNPNVPPMSRVVYVMSGVTDLIVNNANVVSDQAILGDANNWSSVYTSALAATGCTTWGNLDDHNMLIRAFQQNQVQGIKNIYYNVGWTYLSLGYQADSVLIPQLTTFLNGGGRLFISGQDVAYNLDGQFGTSLTRPFMHSMLGAHYVAWGYDPSMSRTLTAKVSDQVFGAVPNDSIINYYGFYSQGGWPNYRPMICHDTLTGMAIFNYNNDPAKVGGTRNTNGTWKTVFLSVGIEMLKTPSVVNQIINNSYQWFNGTFSVHEFDAAMANVFLGQNYPNPGSGNTIIPVGNLESTMTLQVTDALGRVLLEQKVEKGMQQVSVNVASLEAGMYFYRLAGTNGATAAKPMQVIR